jgi:hypothetical protein
MEKKNENGFSWLLWVIGTFIAIMVAINNNLLGAGIVFGVFLLLGFIAYLFSSGVITISSEKEKAESNRGEVQTTSHPSQIYEADIQEFIVKNINLLEDGLRVIEQHKKISKDNKVIGEIDILCKDMDGDYVVVEVKRGVAKRDVAGQIATYWGWVRENLPTGKEPRGIIVASNIDAQLELALIPFGSKIQTKVFGELHPLERNMRHCDKCGQLIPKSANICRSCGSTQWM